MGRGTDNLGELASSIEGMRPKTDALLIQWRAATFEHAINHSKRRGHSPQEAWDLVTALGMRDLVPTRLHLVEPAVDL